MRILITNHALHWPGGTETWTETMATELVGRGHEVEIASFMCGTFADRMPCPVLPIGNVAGRSYDLILVNHNTCLAMVQAVEGFKVFTSHGPAHQLEMPVRGADRYVAVSEEIQERYPHMIQQVIRNPINLKRFGIVPECLIDADVLVATKNAKAAKIVMEAVKANKMSYGLAHYTMNPVYDMTDMIPHYRIVFTCGRGTLEALSCGKVVFSVNHSNGKLFGDGWVVHDKLPGMQAKNYSGRSSEQVFGPTDQLGTTEFIAGELKTSQAYEYACNLYRPDGREWVEQHHDVRNICDQYLNLMDPQEQPEPVVEEAVV